MTHAAAQTRTTDAQRHFVRLKMPARLELEAERFPVRDLSSGGVGVEGVARHYGDGADLSVILILPFDGVSLNFCLTGRVRHYVAASKVLGLQFVNLSPVQVSVLSQVVKAYITGDMVSSQDLLKWESQDGFIKILRKDTPPGQEKTIMPLGAFDVPGPTRGPETAWLSYAGMVLSMALVAVLAFLSILFR